jgi:hypothetical protein
MAIEIEVSARLSVRGRRVWGVISDLSSNPEWMTDVKSVRFTGSKHEGTGTTFDCDTRLFGKTSTDHLLVTQWVDGSQIMVTHQGMFTGHGTLSISEHGDGTCTVTRSERIVFPWYLAGPVGELVAKPAIQSVWHYDMLSLKDLCEDTPDVSPREYFALQGQQLITRRRGSTWTIDVGAEKEYASGSSAYGARHAALKRWRSEHS